MSGEVLAVALAPPSPAGPTTIEFHPLGRNGQIGGVIGSLVHLENHIGALAYATVGKATHLIGCSWDCTEMTFWKADGADRTSGFVRTWHGSTSALVLSDGIDVNVGTYNSLLLVERCEDGEPLLLAGHDD